MNLLEQVQREYNEIKRETRQQEREWNDSFFKYMESPLNVTDQDITLRGQKGRKTWKSYRYAGWG